MSSEQAASVSKGRPASGEHERHLAISTVAQQASQAVGAVALLSAITIVARRLSLSEFGTYGLLVSLTTYLLILQASVETAAVKALAEAKDQAARDRAFTTALSLYTVAGIAAAGLIATAGTELLRVFKIPSGLHHQAQLGVLALAGVTSLSWPLKVFQDVLRGSQRFVASAGADVVAYVIVGGTLTGLALGRAPLWLLVAAGASFPLFTGAASAVIVALRHLPYRYRRAELTRSHLRELVGLSGYFFVSGIADFVIYSLDRAILGSFRPAATVGLYEGPIRAHNLIRQLHGTLATPAFSTAARYLADGDVQRTRDLLIRGTRYILAAVVPIAIVFMVLAGPILKVWLGAKFGAAATAMTVLVAYWLVNASSGVAGSMLTAAGRVRQLTVYAVGTAALNLVLSLSLTPSFGLTGVVLGTTISYAVVFPFFIALTISVFPVSLRDFAREVWLPAYLTGAVIGGGLLAVRLSVRLETVPTVLGASLLAVVAYWVIYYVVWLHPSERLLVKNVAAALIRR